MTLWHSFDFADQGVCPFDRAVDFLLDGEPGCLLCVEFVPAGLHHDGGRPFLLPAVCEQPLAHRARRAKVDRPVRGDELEVDKVAHPVAAIVVLAQPFASSDVSPGRMILLETLTYAVVRQLAGQKPIIPTILLRNPVETNALLIY